MSKSKKLKSNVYDIENAIEIAFDWDHYILIVDWLCDNNIEFEVVDDYYKQKMYIIFESTEDALAFKLAWN